MFKFVTVILAVSAIIFSSSASPLNKTVVDNACVVTNYWQVATVIAKCSNIIINGIQVPAGKTLSLHLRDGASLTFQGHITFAKYNWNGPLVDIRGKRLTIRGQPGHRLDGQGNLYWDGKGGQGSVKPVFVSVSTTQNSLLDTINLLNCPERCVAIVSQDTTFNMWNIDNAAGNKVWGRSTVAINTDGFDVIGKNLIFKNSIITNQDDCVCIGSGSNMKFVNLQCHGSHGLSLAAGLNAGNTGNDITDVTFENCKLIGGMNGIHVKTVPKGGTGVISNVYYKNIEMSGITDYGIRISQDYFDWGHPNKNVPIKGLNFQDIHGTMGGQFSTAVHIECASGGCFNFNWYGVNIAGAKHPNTCNFKPNGFTC